jgi:hypothetical protein
VERRTSGFSSITRSGEPQSWTAKSPSFPRWNFAGRRGASVRLLDGLFAQFRRVLAALAGGLPDAANTSTGRNVGHDAKEGCS